MHNVVSSRRGKTFKALPGTIVVLLQLLTGRLSLGV